jgi:hypothetical protein
MTSEDDLLEELHRAGMLLQHDAALQSLTSLIATTPISGSWWSHPQAHQIYAQITALASHPDVLTVKLVHGKVTFLHRRLWPALLAVATAHDDWQFDTLSKQAHELYTAVEQHGVITATGAIPKELERRLLVQSSQQHTAHGHHELQLTAWRLWADHAACTTRLPASYGRVQLEESLQAIGGSANLLPWNRRSRRV